MASRPYQAISDLAVNTKAMVLVQIESVLNYQNQKGDQMAFLNVTDGINKLDVTLFPENLFHHKDKLSEGGPFILMDGPRVHDHSVNCQNMEEARAFLDLLENHDKDIEVSNISYILDTFLSLSVIKEVRKPSLVKDRVIRGTYRN